MSGGRIPSGESPNWPKSSNRRGEPDPNINAGRVVPMCATWSKRQWSVKLQHSQADWLALRLMASQYWRNQSQPTGTTIATSRCDLVNLCRCFHLVST